MTHSECLSTSCFKLLSNYLVSSVFFREGYTDLAEDLRSVALHHAGQMFTLVITYRYTHHRIAKNLAHEKM